LNFFIDLFKGKNRKLSILFFFLVILFLITIFTIVRFINSTEMVNVIKWGLASLASFLSFHFLIFTPLFKWIKTLWKRN